MLNAATLAAIVAAVWAHPQGVAYLEKIEQIRVCAEAKGNPCCAPQALQPHGGGVVARAKDHRELTYEELNSRYELVELQRAAQAAAAKAAGERLAAINAAKAADQVGRATTAGSKSAESDKPPGTVELDPVVLAAIFDEFF